MPNALEYEIEYASRPAEDTVVLELEFTPGLEFYFQPPLTQEEIDEGYVRPENVVGSYAVYYERSGRIVGGDGAEVVNYETGKLCHIYRPFVRDANGVEVWCEQVIDTDAGTLTITMPSAWLDSAAYPVILGPTFGYSSIGATTAGTGAGAARNAVGLFAPSSSGTLESVSFRCSNNGTNVTLGVYADSSNYPGALVEDTAEGTASASAAWLTCAANSAVAITGGTNYFLAFYSDTGIIRYTDSAAGKKFKYKHSTTGYSAGSMPDPWPADDSSYDNNIFSIYATYTEAAAGGRSCVLGGGILCA